MITELEEVSPDIVGGRKVQVTYSNLRNFRIHQSLEQLSRLLIYCLECDSNNTSSKALPSDVRYMRRQWQIVKNEFAFAILPENNDQPRGNYETAQKVALPYQKEVARIRNVKVKRVVAELVNCAELMMGVDSANTQNSVADEDAASIQSCFGLVDRVMDIWLGGGKDFSDTGIQAPAYEILGKIEPDVDADWRETMEPSKDLPRSQYADVADTPAVAEGPAK